MVSIKSSIFLAIFLFALEVNCENGVEARKRTFTVDYENDVFLMDGKPFRYISGEVHYFRIPHQYWRDRLRAVRAAGLNAVSTYVEWSFHEPEKGQYLWEGDYDLVKFIEMAVEEDLYVLLRPGPYICAERDNGGLPYWLFTMYPEIKLRTNDEDYKKEVAIWYDTLMPKMKPYLYGNGGPIILVQVENEYGMFSNVQHEYVEWLKDLTEKHVNGAALLYTTDGPSSGWLDGGAVDGAYATVDFGTGANIGQCWWEMRTHTPRGPYVNSEFYPGWLTHWGEGMASVSTDSIVWYLGEMLDDGANVNFYMFHGGTNFGFTAGANGPWSYGADITSYDYDAPLTEAGDITEKYLEIRKKVGEYLPLPNISIPENKPKMELLNVKVTAKLNLLQDEGIQLLGKNKKQSKDPLSMEAMGQGFGYILYEADIPKKTGEDVGLLWIDDPRDRVYVYADNKFVSIIDRETDVKWTKFDINSKKVQLLVENQGRINFNIADDIKGIIGNVYWEEEVMTKWTHTSFPVDNITAVHNVNISKVNSLESGPVFYTASFVLNQEPLDTFMDTRGWGKGVVWMNGRNLGRYWPERGPQKTLYVPGVYLNKAPTPNVLTIMEVESAPKKLVVDFLKTPILRD